MNEQILNKLLSDEKYLTEKINFYKKKNIIKSINSKYEIKGHLIKARHNLDFLGEIASSFNDWSLVVCYYASYHAALSLILTKGYFSKSHDATLCILIKEFYGGELSKNDLELLNKFDVQDLLFYAESKNKREDASYSTKTKFASSEVNKIKLNTKLFVNKVEQIINES